MANEPTTVETLTASSIAESHPEIAEALRSEGRAAAAAENSRAVIDAGTTAAAAERARILEIQEATLPGYAALSMEAIAGGLSPAEFALSQAKAQKTAGGAHLAALAADEAALAARLPADAAPTAAAAANDPSTPIADRAKAEWDRSADIRAEFGDNFQRYLAYRQAEDAGQIRRISSKEA